MLTGKLVKDGSWWLADCETIGAFTCGKTRREAAAMLTDCVETLVDPTKIEVTVTETGPIGAHAHAVLVESNNPTLLAATVLCYQREKHKLTIAAVAKKLGPASRAAYAAYENGSRAPSLAQFHELLAAVAPELGVVVGPRATAAATKRRAAR